MEGPFNDPGIPDGERVAYRGLVGDDEAGTGAIEIAAEPDAYRQTVSAWVRDRVQLRSTTVFRRRAGTIHAETHEMETLDGDGPPVATERARFRGPKIIGWGGELESFPRDLTPLLGAALALRGLELEQGARRSFSAWIVSSVYWQVDSRVERKEKVALPAGELEAWRLRLRPSLEQVDKALDSLVDSLMPPLVAHLEVEPPHRFLRLQFPTGPFRWNPVGVIEATEALDGVDPGEVDADHAHRPGRVPGPAGHVLAAQRRVGILVRDDVADLLALVAGAARLPPGLGLGGGARLRHVRRFSLRGPRRATAVRGSGSGAGRRPAVRGCVPAASAPGRPAWARCSGCRRRRT